MIAIMIMMIITVSWLSLLHDYIKQCLNSDYAQVQILLTA